MKTTRIDVRPLLDRGENPLPRLLEAAECLRPGDQLEVTAPFLPAPLIEKLRGDGFVFQVQQAGGGAWVVVFRRPGSPEE